MPAPSFSCLNCIPLSECASAALSALVLWTLPFRPPWEILNLDYSTALNATAVREAFLATADLLHPDRNVACLGWARSEFIAARRAHDTLLALCVLSSELADSPSRSRFAAFEPSRVYIPSSSSRTSSSKAPSKTQRRKAKKTKMRKTNRQVYATMRMRAPSTPWASTVGRVSLVGAAIPLLLALRRWMSSSFASAVEQIKKSASSWWGRARQVLGAAIRAPLQLTNAISALFIQHRSMMLTVLVSTAVVRYALVLV